MDRAGLNGFFWFFGVVEDLDDPLKVGRVRVRIYNVHSFSEAEVPVDMLPWAHVVMPVTSASFNEKGISPTGLLKDTTVFGFFADGYERQKPMILGTVPGIPQPDPENVDPNNISEDNHDVSRLARGINKLADVKNNNRAGVEEVEPSTETSYRAVYPYNKVFETAAGHVIEIDDSPGAERIHVYHNSGSYLEMFKGRTVFKTNGTDIEISMLDKVVRVKGDYLLDIDGNYVTTVGGNMIVDVKGSIQINSGLSIATKSALTTSIDAGLHFTTQSLGYTSISSDGYLATKSGLYTSIDSGGFINIKSGAATSLVSGSSFSVGAATNVTIYGGATSTLAAAATTVVTGAPVLIY